MLYLQKISYTYTKNCWLQNLLLLQKKIGVEAVKMYSGVKNKSTMCKEWFLCYIIDA